MSMGMPCSGKETTRKELQNWMTIQLEEYFLDIQQRTKILST